MALASCGSTDKKLEIDAAAAISWSEVAASYGTIQTVAGKGLVYDKAVNGWENSYEGGLAIDAELSRPHMTVSDSDGILYIADKDAHAIRAVGTDGLITTLAGTGVSGDDGDSTLVAATSRLSSPNGIWINSKTLYVLDLGSQKIRKIQNGMMETLITIPNLTVGRGLWVSPDEELAYIASGSTLYRWTQNNGLSVFASGFSSLGNLAVAATGDVFVTDRSGNSVYKVDQDGTKTKIAGTGTNSGGGDGSTALELALDEVRGIALHPRGGYFLATHKGGQIWYVDQSNIAHLFLNGDDQDTHAGDGSRYNDPTVRISEPRGIHIAPNEDFIITENDAGFVRVIKSLNESIND